MTKLSYLYVALALGAVLLLATVLLFPVYLRIFVWGGLWLRDVGMKAFIPTRA